MSRVAAQPDLFSPPPEVPPPPADPMAELTDLLARLRAASTPPWPTISAAMQEEYRALGLAREAGAECAALAAAILEQTERLLAMTD